MISDIDIWRTAWVLRRQYGDLASAEAERRAQALSAGGDGEGAAVWYRIRTAVAELGSTAPASVSH